MACDVLVIGAGPAGSVAALVLARAGARVCLVDRAALPRPKLCGDTLNPGALGILHRLGIGDGIERHGLPIDGMRVTGDGVVVDARYPRGLRGVSMRRDDLDLALVHAAASAGVDVRTQVRAAGPIVEEQPGSVRVAGVACTGPTGVRFELRAPVTIAADGRRSALALALGLTRHPEKPRRWAIGVHAAGMEGLSAFGEMHIRRGYYVGVAPLPGGLANLCVVRPAAAAEDGFRDPAGTLRRILEAEPILRERTTHMEFASRPLVLGPLAVDTVPGAAMPPGLLLAGDAAGFIDPMTGDGMRFALRGGELAADAAIRALAHGWNGVHAHLEQARRQEFAAKWRFNRALRALVGSAMGVRSATLAARAMPASIRLLIRHASDCARATA